MAVALGISRVLIHKYSSVLSAYGMALADMAQELQEPCSLEYDAASHVELGTRIQALSTRASTELKRQDLGDKNIRTEVILNMRYRGSQSQLIVPIPPGTEEFGKLFSAMHAREFGFTSDRPVLVDDIRVRSTGSRNRVHEESPFTSLNNMEKKEFNFGQAAEVRSVYFEGGWRSSPVFKLGALAPGSVVRGPSIIIDSTQTLVVTPNATATLLPPHVVLDLGETGKAELRTDQVDPFQLAIFGNRFMAIPRTWGAPCRRSQSAPTSRSAWTSLVPSSTLMVA